MDDKITSLAVVIPAAGVGKRMQANCPKQYLKINELTILEHTALRLLSHPNVGLVVIALGKNDEYFPQTSLCNLPNVQVVIGGNERVDSVLAGLKVINNDIYPWAMVHDAARPCVTHQDISNLISQCMHYDQGGLLASPVRDTMKQASISTAETVKNSVDKTIERNHLWHAFTPQMYKTDELILAIEAGLNKQMNITDESSAIEMFGLPSQLIEGRGDNIKITRKDDLAMAAFILQQQLQQQTRESSCE